MPTKYQIMQEELNRRIADLWHSAEAYKSLLFTSSRVYKYSFKDQVLINAQRPDAVACAEFDTWSNERITNRYIKRGSKGIALLNEQDGKAKLRYVFDFADTAPRDERSKEPFFWKVSPESESAVISRLGVPAQSLDDAVMEKASALAREYSDNYIGDLLGNIEGTFMEDLDEYAITAEFEKILETSIAYTVMARCGYDPDLYFEHEDFVKLFDFNTVEAMTVLGTAVSDLSEMMLRNIERTLKAERSKENERFTENNDRGRDNIPSGRENADIPAGLGDTGTEADRQVRSDAPDIFEETQESDISSDAAERHFERAFSGNGRDSETQALGDNADISSESGSDRGAESDRSNALGGSYEQSESAGGGADSERADIQLNNENEAVSELSDTASSLDKAKQLIDEYTYLEFGEDADYSDLHHIDLAFTTDVETGLAIEVFADLVDHRIVKMYGGEIAEEAKFDSIADMYGTLGNLEFDSLVVIDNEAVKTLGISSEAPSAVLPFSEEELSAIVNRYDFRKVSKEVTLEFFLENDSSTERADFVRSGYDDTYTEFIIDGVRYGSKGEDEGLRVWRGGYMNNDGEGVISWYEVQRLTAELIEKHEFYDITPVPETFDVEPGIEETGGYSDTGQLSFFDDTDISAFEPMETREQLSSVTPDMIDYMLRSGSNQPDSLLRIIAHFQKHSDISENADFLRKEFLFRKDFDARGYEYESADGLKAAKVSALFEQNGITLGIGNKAKTFSSVSVTWEQAAERISELLSEGRYAEQKKIDAAHNYEIVKAAEDIWYLHQEIADRSALFIPSEMFEGGFPDSTSRIAVALTNPDTLREYVEGFTALSEQYAVNRDMMRANFHKPPNTLALLEELQLPRTEYRSAPGFKFSSKRFITEDDKDIAVMRGSNIRGGKVEIEAFFKQAHTLKEKADYLKREYGVGGSGTLGYDIWHDSKGFFLSIGEKNDAPAQVKMKWNEIAERISRLVAQGRYLTDRDIKSYIEDCKEILRNKNDLYSDTIIDKARHYLESHGVEIPEQKPRAAEAETPELSTVEAFKAKTDKMFHPLESVDDAADIEDIVRDFAEQMFEEYGISAEINDVVLSGSRCRGLENESSDIDVIISVNSDSKEYELFNALHGEEIEIDGIPVDINPITPQETGTLDDYLPTVEAYLQEKAAEMQKMSEHEEAAESEETNTAAVVEDEPDYDAPEYELKVGDIIELDDGTFRVDEIKDTVFGVEYSLLDLGGVYPIFRAISEDELYDKGYVLISEADEQEKSDETLAAVTGDGTEDVKLNSIVIDLTPRETPNISKVPELTGEKHDFRITDENLGVGGEKVKYKANVAAIRLLNELEAENRRATPEEQEILSRYVGWGALSAAFDENNSSWSAEYAEVKALLTPDEYESAKASTINAHYTSPVVIAAMYEGLKNLGFTGGNVLEPAMGVGNFFGMMPEEMSESKLYGVEIDSITGRIAKQLYQHADIQVTGFENTKFPDNFFDVAVGNVPFGLYKLAEKRYDKLNLNIHDHFFAKALDKVRAGGVIAFVTSKGTLDKSSEKFRKYLAQRAELLGAIRLPSNTFLANAGTEVTSDIIFLQKREKIIDIEPDWVHIGQTTDGVPVNKYFEEHPEMILGIMKQGIEYSLYGNPDATACEPIEGTSLKEQLAEAVKHIQGTIPEIAHDEGEKQIQSIPADPDVRNYSYTVIDNNIYYRENSVMFLKDDLPKATAERIKAMCELRDCVRKLIDLQVFEHSDDEIWEQQLKLNAMYDKFSAKFGLINSSANSKAFSEDDSYYLLSSLEVLNENGELERKADMFTKRTIKQNHKVESVDTAAEALAVSIAEKACVDMEFMSLLSGKTEDELYSDLQGTIFLNPRFQFSSMGDDQKYLTADDYLSGNIREKLHIAEMAMQIDPEKYGFNVEKLTEAIPKPLEASEIDVRLGATWIEPDDIKRFIVETMQMPYSVQRSISVHYCPQTAEWLVEGKNCDNNNVNATMTYGTDRKNAYSIIEDTLNLRDARVYDRVEDPDGKVKSVLNKKETMLAQEKQEAIKNAFREWIFKDPDRRERLVAKYNELFNSVRPREYDGSHLTLEGVSPEIELRPHQLNAIAHTIYGGNTLLAHVVGAGKTFEMVAAAMESKRLGLCSKSLFVVPNHLTEQMGAEFLRLYPAANILVATAKDFETQNRKKLCSKIATGDYDAVIIGHSQLEKIPVSPERQERMIRRQIVEIEDGLISLGKSEGARFAVKQLEKTKRSLEARLKRLLESPKRDDVVTFEELGIDKMFVDEAHGFKNLFLYTKMRNVAGIAQTEAQKSSDLYNKCQYLDEITGGKGIVFATGTPVSNSMTELYTMMRYLQSDTLARMGMQNFDAWAANFGEAATAIELAPEGTGYRAKTRFSKFFNLPELMSIFKEAADIKTADMLDLDVPEAHFHNIAVEPTELQKEMVSALSERAAKVHNKQVEPEKDNMLKITNDGRKIGLDQRLIDPALPDDPNSKVNACINNVFKIYEDHSDIKATQLIFCDFSTPKGDGSFNLYDDIRNKLIAMGIPKEEIAFIHEADTEVKKKELFAKVRKGQVRILLGSTSKCGAGTNIQDKLIALHHLDCPWRPSDLEQREGRIIRQGNDNKEVDVFRYVTKSTFDAYLYQMIENKQRFISQIMSSKSPVRSCEDVDEATLSYAEVKALCAGNPLIKEKMDLDVAVTKLKVLKANHTTTQYRLEDSVRKHFPQRIKLAEERIAGYEADLAHLKTVPKVSEGISPMVILNQSYTDKESAGKALFAAKALIKGKEAVDIGSYKGFDMALSFDSFSSKFVLQLKNEMTYNIILGDSETGNILRIDNALDGIEKNLIQARSQLETVNAEFETAKASLGAPFPQEEELQAKIKRLAELDVLLNMDTQGEQQEQPEQPEQKDAAEKKPDIPLGNGKKESADRKPSILGKIKAAKAQQSEQKPPTPPVPNKNRKIR